MNNEKNNLADFSATTTLRIAAFSMVAVLAACGGGGGGDDTPTEAPPTTTPVVPAPEPTQPVQAPTSSYSGFKLAAFNRLNAARIAVGVSGVNQNAQLDAAAQAHALYMGCNRVSSHYEASTDPFFTGVDYAARATAQGYKNPLVTELVTWFGRESTGEEHIDWHLNSVYHLAGALNPKANEIGIGMEDVTSPTRLMSSSFTLGATTNNVVLKANTRTIAWPMRGAVDVPRSFYPATESPNPMPDVAPNTSIAVGSPIMFCGVNPQVGTLHTYGPLGLRSASLTKRGQGEPVDGMRLIKAPSVKIDVPEQIKAEIVSDANLATLGMENCIFMVPKKPLEPNQQYSLWLDGYQTMGGPSNITFHFSSEQAAFTTGK